MTDPTGLYNVTEKSAGLQPLLHQLVFDGKDTKSVFYQIAPESEARIYTLRAALQRFITKRYKELLQSKSDPELSPEERKAAAKKIQEIYRMIPGATKLITTGKSAATLESMLIMAVHLGWDVKITLSGSLPTPKK